MNSIIAPSVRGSKLMVTSSNSVEPEAEERADSRLLANCSDTFTLAAMIPHRLELLREAQAL
jgi:hypothetical protein